MKDLTPEQALAVAQAVYSEMGKVVSTKEPTSLRYGLSSGLRRLYHETHIVGKLPITDDEGKQVGVLTGKVSKPSTKVTGECEDLFEFWDNLDKDIVLDWVYDNKLEEFMDWMAQNGIATPGLRIVRHTDPGGVWLGTTLTGCKPEDVLPSLAPELAGAMENLRAALPGEVG